MKVIKKKLKQPKLARDLDGYVHTRHGFMSRETYESIRQENPQIAFPEHAALPLLNELEPKDERL
jgi:hypothetical protein